jgi:hypothetical protein
MWNQMGFQLPGMVTPTLDEGELDKQIKDLKSVENWLRMNLSMLQMTIQNLEMQKSALGTFRTMSSHFTQHDAPAAPPENPFSAFFQAAQAAQPPQPEPEPAATPVNANNDSAGDEAALAKAAMWPWEMMNDINAKMQEQLAEATKNSATAKVAKKAGAKPAPAAVSARQPAAKKTSAKPRAKKPA